MVLKNKKVIFLLPSKTGSTALNSLLKENNIEYKNSGYYKHPFLSEVLKSQNIKDFYNYDIYQLCRNPIERMVSAYFFQRQIIRNKKKYSKFFKLNFNEFVELITSNTHLLPDHINRFCYNVFDDVDFGKSTSPTGYGVRFYLPQVKWNDTGMKVKYLKLENLTKDCSSLSSILGTNKKLSLPKVNITKKKTKRPYIEMYNKKSLDLLIDTYQEDFKILDYAYPT